MSYIGITLIQIILWLFGCSSRPTRALRRLTATQPAQRPVKLLDGIIKMWRKTYAAAQRANHIYLDKDVIQYLNEKCLTSHGSLQLLVNDLLRKDIEISKHVAS